MTIAAWAFSLSADPFTEARYAGWLDVHEAARARHFAFPKLRRRYVVGHARLRQVLAGYLGVHPADITIAYGEHGRPYLSGPGSDRLRFSLAHDGDVAIAAVAAGMDVGIDVEALRIIPEAEALMSRQLVHAVAPTVLPAAEPARSAAFLQWWTRMEAIAKARGVGLAAPDGGSGDWTARNVPAPVPGHVVAVAARGNDWTVEVPTWLCDGNSEW